MIDLLKSIFWIRTYKRWIFTVDDKVHSVTIDMDWLYNRTLKHDGRVIVEEQVSNDGGGEYVWERDGHQYRLRIESAYWTIRRFLPREGLCHLYRDGTEVL